jgi:hypothetical protein
LADQKVTEVLELQGDSSGAEGSLKRVSSGLEETERSASRAASRVSGAANSITGLIGKLAGGAGKFAAVMGTVSSVSSSGFSGAAAGAGTLLASVSKLHPAAAAAAVGLGLISDKSKSLKEATGALEETVAVAGKGVESIAGPILDVLGKAIRGVNLLLGTVLGGIGKSVQTVGTTVGATLKGIFTLNFSDIGRDIGDSVKKIWQDDSIWKGAEGAGKEAGRDAAQGFASGWDEVAREHFNRLPGLGKEVRLLSADFGKEDLQVLDEAGRGIEDAFQRIFEETKLRGDQVDLADLNAKVIEWSDAVQADFAEAMRAIREEGKSTEEVLSNFTVPAAPGLADFIRKQLEAYSASLKTAEAQRELTKATEELADAQDAVAQKQSALNLVMEERRDLQRDIEAKEREMLPLADGIRDTEQELAQLQLDQTARRERLVELGEEQEEIERRISGLQAEQAKALAALEPLRQAAAEAAAREQVALDAVREQQDRMLPLQEQLKSQRQELTDLQSEQAKRERALGDEVERTSDIYDAQSKVIAQRRQEADKAIRSVEASVERQAEAVRAANEAEGARIDGLEKGYADLQKSIGAAQSRRQSEMEDLSERVENLSDGFADQEELAQDRIKGLSDELEAYSETAEERARSAAKNIRALSDELESFNEAVVARQRETARGLRAIEDELESHNDSVEESQRATARGVRAIADELESFSNTVEDRQRETARGVRAIADELERFNETVEAQQRASAEHLRGLQDNISAVQRAVSDAQRARQRDIAAARDELEGQLEAQQDLLDGIDRKYEDQLRANETIVEAVTEKWRAELEGARKAQEAAERAYALQDRENRKQLLQFARQRAAAQGIADPNQRIAALARINRAEAQYTARVKDRLDALQLEAQIAKENADLVQEERDTEKSDAEANITRIKELVEAEKSVIQERIAAIKEEGEERITSMQKASEIQDEADRAHLQALQDEYDLARRAAEEQARHDEDARRAMQERLETAQAAAEAERERDEEARRAIDERLAAAQAAAEAERERDEAARRALEARLEAAQRAAEAERERDEEARRALEERLEREQEAENARREAEEETSRLMRERLEAAQEAQERQADGNRKTLEAEQERLELLRDADRLQREGEQSQLQTQRDALDLERERVQEATRGREAALRLEQERLASIRAAEADRREAEEVALEASRERLEQAQELLAIEQRRNQDEREVIQARIDATQRSLDAEERTLSRLQREAELLGRTTQATQDRLQREEEAINSRFGKVLAEEQTRLTSLQARIELEEDALGDETRATEQRLARAQAEYNLRKSILDEEGEKALRPIDARIRAAEREVELAQVAADYYRQEQDRVQEILNAAKEAETAQRSAADLASTRLERERQAMERQAEIFEQLKRDFGDPPGGVFGIFTRVNGALTDLAKAARDEFPPNANGGIPGIILNALNQTHDQVDEIFRGMNDDIVGPGGAIPNLRRGVGQGWEDIKRDTLGTSGSFMQTWGAAGGVRRQFSDIGAAVTGSGANSTMGALRRDIDTTWDDIKRETLSTGGPFLQTWGAAGGVRRQFTDAGDAITGGNAGSVMSSLRRGLDTAWDHIKADTLASSGPLQRTAEGIVTSFENTRKGVAGSESTSVFSTLKTEMAQRVRAIHDQQTNSTDPQSAAFLASKMVGAFDGVKTGVTGPNGALPQLHTDMATAFGNMKTGLIDNPSGALAGMVGGMVGAFTNSARAIVTGDGAGLLAGGAAAGAGGKVGIAGLPEGLTGVMDNAKEAMVGKDGVSGAVGGTVRGIVGGTDGRGGFSAMLPAMFGADNKGGVMGALKAGMEAHFQALGLSLVAEGGGGKSSGAAMSVVTELNKFFDKWMGGGTNLNAAPDANVLKHMFYNDKGFGETLITNMQNYFRKLGPDNLADYLSVHRQGGGEGTNFPSWMAARFTDIANDASVKAKPIGKKIGEGIIAGLADMHDELTEAGKAAARKALDGAQDELDIKSPSRKAADKVGQPFVEGIINGVERMRGRLARSVAGLANVAVRAAQIRLLGLGAINLPSTGSVGPNLAGSLLGASGGRLGATDNRHFNAGQVNIYTGKEGVGSLRDQEWQALITR